MKKLTMILPIFNSLMIILASCEEIIDIDLNSVNPRIVIEGIITDQVGPYAVRISSTTDYYNPGEIPMLSGAKVVVSDNAGNSDTFTETSAGIYQSDSLQGIPGRQYSLLVRYQQKSFQALSTMPQAIEIDSLYLEEEQGFRGKNIDLVCVFQDRPGAEDFCRFKMYRNRASQGNYSLYNGRLSDGKKIEYRRFRETFDMNDTLKVELQSIDQAIYEYYSTLRDVIASDPRGLGSSSVPANPITNLSAGALGYFAAMAVRADSIVVR